MLALQYRANLSFRSGITQSVVSRVNFARTQFSNSSIDRAAELTRACRYAGVTACLSGALDKNARLQQAQKYKYSISRRSEMTLFMREQPLCIRVRSAYADSICCEVHFPTASVHRSSRELVAKTGVSH